MRTPATRLRLASITTAAALMLTACTPGEPGSTQPPQATERTPTMTPTSPAAPEHPSPGATQGTAVLITIGDTTVPGQLWDNPAARDLAARLPVTLTFSDFNAVEMTAGLDPALTMDGMPTGDDPNPGEIGWYAPSGNLVLYYGDVGFWNGIARLGIIDDAGTELLAEAPQDITVTIAPADG